MERVILHSDLNSFYANVECLYNPDIREKPVAVCGSTEQRHGIVLTKNAIAKRYGVSTGEAIWQAKQKCPGLVIVQPNFDRYMRFSREARKIYERYSDRVESFGLDECWLDVTGGARSGPEIAEDIRNTIREELGITVSVGVSWNKIFAKLGSDMKKPDAVTVIRKEDFKTKVWRLPACDLLYVGPATARKLARFGIHTIGELAQADPDFLRCQFNKCGETMWAFANGYDVAPVAPSGESGTVKSIGNSMTTWRDIENWDDAWRVLATLSENVAQRLREGGFRCRTVQLSVRDTNLNWFERQEKLGYVCCTSAELAKTAMQLLKQNYDFRLPLRSLGVRACDLCDASSGLQLAFFEDSRRREKWERIESSLDDIRRRFGRGAVQRAFLLEDNIAKDETPQTHMIHPNPFYK